MEDERWGFDLVCWCAEYSQQQTHRQNGCVDRLITASSPEHELKSVTAASLHTSQGMTNREWDAGLCSDYFCKRPYRDANLVQQPAGTYVGLFHHQKNLFRSLSTI